MAVIKQVEKENEIFVPSSSHTIIFNEPITHNNKTYASITLRPLTFNEKILVVRWGNESDRAVGLEQILYQTHLCSSPVDDATGKMPLEAIRKLPEFYLEEILEYFASFSLARKKFGKI